MFYSTSGKDDVIYPHRDCYVVKTSADTQFQLLDILCGCTCLYLPNIPGHILVGNTNYDCEGTSMSA